MPKTKMLWHSNAPWSPTGYGSQTALFAPALAEHYDLSISSFYGLEGAPRGWEGIPVLPGIAGTYGDEPLVQHAKHTFDGDPRGGLVTTLMDVWVLDTRWMEQLNLACWVPVDHDPPPPKVVSFFMQTGAVPIAMSRFGERMLGRIDPLYCPHAVDTDVYRPHDRDTVREELGVPAGAWLVGMVAANKGRPSRKGFAQALQAFARFAERHDDAYLYLHTMISAQSAAGEDIAALIEMLGIPPHRVMIADQYRMMFSPYSPKSMAKVYSALDVLLNPAWGEGFGIPVLEAHACGVPAIVTDFSAMSEVCSAGWRVGYEKFWTGLASWQAFPKVDEIYEVLEECYGLPTTRRLALSHQAREHALGYSLPVVMDKYMLPALRTAEQRYSEQTPVRIPSRLKVAA